MITIPTSDSGTQLLRSVLELNVPVPLWLSVAVACCLFVLVINVQHRLRDHPRPQHPAAPSPDQVMSERLAAAITGVALTRLALAELESNGAPSDMIRLARLRYRVALAELEAARDEAARRDGSC